MAYNPDLSEKQRDELMLVHDELGKLHERVNAITCQLQKTRNDDAFETTGKLLDVQLGISHAMIDTTEALFT